MSVGKPYWLLIDLWRLRPSWEASFPSFGILNFIKESRQALCMCSFLFGLRCGYCDQFLSLCLPCAMDGVISGFRLLCVCEFPVLWMVWPAASGSPLCDFLAVMNCNLQVYTPFNLPSLSCFCVRESHHCKRNETTATSVSFFCICSYF